MFKIFCFKQLFKHFVLFKTKLKQLRFSSSKFSKTSIYCKKGVYNFVFVCAINNKLCKYGL